MMSALRLGQERAHLRRHHHEFAAAAQHAHVGIAQQAEAGRLDRIGGGVALRQAVFAHAEKGEIVVRASIRGRRSPPRPRRRQRRRIGAIGLDRLDDAGAHRRPVAAPRWRRRRRPCSRPATSRSRASGSSIRSRWMWMKLSRFTARAAAAASSRRRGGRGRRRHRARRRGSDARRGSARSPGRRSRRGSNRAGTACCR